MHRSTSIVTTVFTVAIILIMALASTGFAQQANQPANISAIFNSMSGDWIGTVAQSTNGKPADTKYFHLSVQEKDPNTYVTQMEYYRIDKQTGEPVQNGASTLTTQIVSPSEATNTLTGKGDILITPDDRKPETHNLAETVTLTPSGEMQGTGSGSISVSGMPLGLGKNGKVSGYSSTWSVNNNTLKLSQELQVEFRFLLIKKTFDITANYTATRGTDIMTLVRAA